MNKKKYSMSLAALMFLGCNAMAKDIYLSANGSDTNNGASAEAAYATLTKALAGATNGDVIKVSGMIKVSEVGKKAHLNGNGGITFEGANPAQDGFDAEGQCGVLWLNNSKVTLKNLAFKNAKAGMTAKSDGSGASAVTGSPLILEVDNCIFENNASTTADGNVATGAIALTGAKLNNEPTYLKVTNSQFIGNSSTVSGGAIYCIANVPVTIENCVFKNNSASGNAGAIFVQDPSKLTIANTAFISNTAPNGNGGAVQINYNKQTKEAYLFSGCTFYDNSAKSFGGAVQFRGQNDVHTVNFVNCTVYGNRTINGGPNEAGGLYLGNLSNISVNLVNTILERNVATAAKVYCDVNAGATKVNLVSTVVGNFKDYTADKYTTDTKSIIGKTVKAEQYGYATVGALTEKNYLPLTVGAATEIGDASKASEYGVTKDLLGNTIGTKIGAVQVASDGGDGDWNISGLAVDGKTVTAVRTLYPGEWNTICLPFAMTTAEQKEQFGEDAKVVYLNGNEKGDKLVFINNKSAMSAGCPYLVKVGEGKAQFKMTKEATALNYNETLRSRNNGTYTFQGVFQPAELDVATSAFLGSNNTLMRPEEGKNKMYGLRAYFKVPAQTSVESIVLYGLGTNGNGTTGIDNVENQVNDNAAKIYTLAGVYVGTDASQLAKGVYIKNGKKFIVK